MSDVAYPIKIPPDVPDYASFLRYGELRIFRRVLNLGWTPNNWDPATQFAAARRLGESVTFHFDSSFIEQQGGRDPAEVAARPAARSAEYDKTQGQARAALNQEIDRRYHEGTSTADDEKIKPGERSKIDLWNMYRDDVLADRKKVESLPADLQDWMGGTKDLPPEKWAQVLRIADKLKQLTPEDRALYKLLAIRQASNLDLFEKSLDVFLAKREEIRRAFQAASAPPPSPDAGDAAADDAALSATEWRLLTEEQKYRLARRRAAEATKAQLAYLAAHPGEAALGFVQGMNPVNPETFREIGKDLAEAADGDADAWARFAGGAGAGAKIAGWILAVGTVLYVLSWAVGIGELATLAVVMEYALVSMAGLSLVESELRIKAASRAKTPEEFDEQIQKAAAARLNFLLVLALWALGRAFRFLAKTYFPETMKRLQTMMGRLRERVRIFGNLADRKRAVAADLAKARAELVERARAAKESARRQAAQIREMSLVEFTRRLAAGDLPGMKGPADPTVPWNDLLKTPEGRRSIQTIKDRYAAVEPSDLAEFDAQLKELTDRIDKALDDVNAARTQEELAKAVSDFDRGLKEEGAASASAREQRAQQRAEEAAARERARVEAEEQARARTRAAEQAQSGGGAAESGPRDTLGYSGDWTQPTAAKPHLEYIKGGVEFMDANGSLRARLNELLQPELSPRLKQMDAELTQAFEEANAKLGKRQISAEAYAEELAKLIEKQEDLAKEIEAHRAARKVEAEHRMGELRRKLHSRNQARARNAEDFAQEFERQGKIAPEVKAALGKRYSVAQMLQDVAEYHRLTGRTPGPDRLKFVKTEDRAHYDPIRQELNIGNTLSKKTVFHELGHDIDYQDPNISAAAKRFVEARAAKANGGNVPAPEQLSKLNPDGKYEPYEIALRDEFRRAYTGKLYADAATEVMTTALEEFTSPAQMLELFRTDPEHFFFALGVLLR